MLRGYFSILNFIFISVVWNFKTNLHNKLPLRLRAQDIITVHGQENNQWKVTQYDVHGSKLDSANVKLFGITNVELDGKSYLAMSNEYVLNCS